MQETATRATLDPRWQESRKLLDWMHVPGVSEYVNKLVSGKNLHEGGHWAVYAKRAFLDPLVKKLGRPLTMVTLGSGDCHIEATLIRDFEWPIEKIVCLEYDEQLRQAACRNLADLPLIVETEFLDFNNPVNSNRTADIVFCCHAIHHANDLELLLPFINGHLNIDGLFLGIEYFGPTRFQVEYDTREILKHLDKVLPAELKLDLREEVSISKDLQFASIKEVRDADVSEAVRSSDLRTLLFANFPVEEIRPMGGTLLRWLFQYRAGNFSPHNPSHVAIAQLLIYIETLAIENRLIKSDDLFFVCRRSDTLD